MKKKWIIIIALCLLVVIAIVCVCVCAVGRRPFENLRAEDIQRVSLEVSPPIPAYQTELTEEEIAELVPLLQEAKVYNPTTKHWFSGGGLCRYTIKLKSGETLIAQPCGSVFIYNGVGYRSEYEENEALNRFGNIIADTGFY